VRAVTARPFPYAALARFSAADAALLRGALRALTTPSARATAEAEALLGVRAELRPGVVELWPAADARAALAAPSCALWLEHDAGARALPLVCQLAPELGAALVDRVLGGDGKTAHVAGAVLDEVSAGVLAYLAARVCAASAAELRVRAPLRAAEEAHARVGDARVLVWPLALALSGEHAGTLRVFIAESTARALATRAQIAPRRSQVATLPIALCAHAARVTLHRRELAALAVGDVIIPDRCALARDARGYAGPIELHAIGNARVLLHAQAHAAALTIDAVTGNGEDVMSEGKRIQTAALDAARLGDDVPLELCLEVARFNLPLGELSALAPGEILSTGRAIGEHVALSIAGRVVARGELVDIDGEIGMRVLELAR
jgi:type III secretion system YscQ/HrcQ family protein